MLAVNSSRISQISARGEKVQNLAYLLNAEMLKACFTELDPNKAAGIDKVTKEEYARNLDENLAALVSRMKGGTYSPKPSRRVYIDKPGTNKKRPLGISCMEDKIVERAIAKLLVEVYEPKFLDCSYGFRPERNCHQAVSTLFKYIHGLTGYVVEADIRSCFDTIDHDWMIKFLEHDIADRRFIELINRGLKAGHFEEGVLHYHTCGTMQGAGYSPVLANVYLHYTLDTWFRYLSEKAPAGLRFRGAAHLVRYADDFVCCFQYREDAERFYNELIVRFHKYGFDLAEEKTRILKFGRFAQRDLDKFRQQGNLNRTKPETFCFLGFEFYCSKGKQSGKFCCKVKSDGKRVRTKLAKLKAWLVANRNLNMDAVFKHFNNVLNGYYNYYAVTCNLRMVRSFRYRVCEMIFKWMNRRSQRKSFSWDRFKQILSSHPIVEPVVKVNIYTYCG